MSNSINFKNLKSLIASQKNTELIFFCIGTDKVIGDCIGPITGTLLKNKTNNINIYGDIQENLNYNNVFEKAKMVTKEFSNPFIIAIDAALSSEENIGKIFIENTGIKIRRSLIKNKQVIGNISIKAVVGKNYNDDKLNFQVLQNVPLKEVIKLSAIISDGIINCIE